MQPNFTVYPIALPNLGIDVSKPEQLLMNRYSPYSRNMEYFNQLIRGRRGLTKLSNTELSGPVLIIDQYWKFTSAYDLMVGTTKDMYKYDFNNDRYDILTPVNIIGTIEIVAGSLNVVQGTGTAWDTTGAEKLKAGDYIKIGSGDIHTDSTWYEIESVDSDTQLTLTGDAVETASGTAYVVRKCFTGGSNDIWQAVQYLDDAEGEVWICTNGVDLPMWYNGTGQLQEFASYPTDFTAAKFITIFYDRIVFGWTREGGQNQPIRVRWSATANFQSYNDLHFVDLNLPTAAYWIKGFTVMGNQLIVNKEYRAYSAVYVGGDVVFDFRFESTFEGNFSGYSQQQLQSGIFYFGYDNRFRFWNTLRDESIFDQIFDFLITLDPTQSEYVYGYQVEGRKQLRWSLPYDATNNVSPMLVYDYENSSINIWEYNISSAIRSIGEYLEVADSYVDDAEWAELYVDEEDGFWDDRRFLANAPVILYGCADGYVRKADTGNDDDGNAYPRTFRFSRLDFGMPDRIKRLWKQQYWLTAETAGSLTARFRKDDQTAWEATQKTIALTKAGKDIAKVFVEWNKYFENCQIELTANNHWEMIGVLNWVKGLKSTA